MCPSRILDQEDRWTDALIHVSNFGRKRYKTVALHTHFNHPNEITWITQEAAQKLYRSCIIVRNQTVLLRGINNDLRTMKQLIRDLADMNIQPVSSFLPRFLSFPGSASKVLMDTYSITCIKATWSVASRICELRFERSLILSGIFEGLLRAS